jgi:hypothetical protein
MCKKCARSIHKAKLPFGKINYFAHYVDETKYADIPLFVNKHDNLAIEGRLWQIRQAKTKRRYVRNNKVR